MLEDEKKEKLAGILERLPELKLERISISEHEASAPVTPTQFSNEAQITSQSTGEIAK